MAGLQTVGAFELLGPLGTGGMGEVHLARHLEHGTRVALKALTLPDERMRSSFQGEIQAACRLEHPHVARVFAHGFARGSQGPLPEGTPWYAMELLRSDLETELRGMRAWAEVAPLLAHLLDALAHAHARGVIHRDLKASNVLFGRPDDQRPGLKLVDFGIAAAGRDAVRGVGTPSAMALELWDDDLAAVGPWSDIYALGVMVWRIATGQKPIRSDELPLLLYRQSKGAFDAFEPRLDVPRGLEGWLRTCMAPQPEDRFLCVADARHALEELLDGPLVPASESEEITEPLDDAATLSFDDLEAPPALESLPSRVRPAPVGRSWRDPLPEPAPVHVAGIGLSVLPWREPGLVGRDDLRALLWSALVQTAQRRAPLALHLEGPRGVGTTALGRWLVERARAHSGALAVHVAGRAGAAPGQGAQELIDALLQPLGPAGSLPGRRKGLARHGCQHGATVAALEGLEQAGSDPVQAALAVVAGLARRRPLVIFVDDAHHDPSLKALAPWAERVRGPVLWLFRGADGGPRAQRVDVGPLPRHEASQLLKQLLPVDARLEEGLLERTAGRPAALRALLERIAPDLALGPDGGFHLPEGLPAPVDDPLARLEGFSALDQRCLELAALLGRDVPRALWVRATGAPPKACDLLAHRLVARGLARNDSGLALEPELAVALRRRAVAEGRAAALHGAIARALEGLGQNPLDTGRAWVRAGEVERGLRVWLDGADGIIRASGPRGLEAVLHEVRLRLPTLPEQEALHGRCEVLRIRMAHEARDPRVRPRAVELQDLAEARGWHDTGLAAARLDALAAGIVDKDRLYRAAIERWSGASAASRGRVLLSWYLIRERFRAPDRDERHEAARQALTTALATGDGLDGGAFRRPQVERMLHVLQSVRKGRDGDHAGVLRHLEAAVALSRRHSALTLSSDLLDLGMAHVGSGDLARADAAFREAGEWGRWLGIAADEAMAITNRAGLAVLQGRFQRGAELAQRAMPGTAQGYLRSVLRLFVWVPRVQAGRFDGEALDEVARGLLPVMPPDREVVAAVTALAEAADARGQRLPPSFDALLEVTRGG